MKDFAWTLLQSLYFLFIPGFANLAPVLARAMVPQWKAPLDCHLTFRGLRLLGDHKTWRGIVAGILMGQLCFFLQEQMAAQFDLFARVRMYDSNAPWFLGALLGLAALLGDAVKSFFKRRAKVAPGVDWVPWDQIDWLISSVLVAWPYHSQMTWLHAVLIIVSGMGMHVLFKQLGYLLRLDKKKVS